MTSGLFEQVQRIAADLFLVPPAQITADSSPETLEGWDSVQHLNLILSLEQTFQVRIDPEDMDRMQTVGQIAELVESKLSGR
jgi:acyl carrier protein